MKTLCFFTSLAIASTSMPQDSTAGDCNVVVAKHMRKSNGTLFYNSSSGFKVVENGESMINIKGNSIYLLRKNLRKGSAGGVLVVKIGSELSKSEKSESTVTLLSTYKDKFITQCSKNAKLKNQLTSIFGSKVSYLQYQTYIKKPSAGKVLDSTVRKLLDKLFFAYKGSIDIDNDCDKNTGSKNNLRQHSLVKSDTGATTQFANLGRSFGNIGFVDSAAANHSLDWTVRVIPYDRSADSRSTSACITITAPEISQAQVVRVNDLEERQPGTDFSDPEYNKKHFGDRSFSLR